MSKKGVVSKKRKNQKTADSGKFGKIVLILTFILGSGAVWEWQQIKLQKVERISKIRGEMITNYNALLNMYAKSIDFTLEMDKYIMSTSDEDVLKRESVEAAIERIWKYEYPMVLDHLMHLEQMLAELEGREPEEFDLPVRPTYNLKASRTEDGKVVSTWDY